MNSSSTASCKFSLNNPRHLLDTLVAPACSNGKHHRRRPCAACVCLSTDQKALTAKLSAQVTACAPQYRWGKKLSSRAWTWTWT